LLSPDINRINTCLIFAGEDLITGTDEGQLVLWKDEPTIYSGHQEMVTCLAVIEVTSSFVKVASGSKGNLEGGIEQIILWTLSNG
jgi:hypothetical protein